MSAEVYKNLASLISPRFFPMTSQSPYSNSLPAPATRRRRAQIACRNCRKRKIRCVTNEEPPHDPCERCQRMNLVCEYVAVGDPSPPSTPTPERSGYINPGSSYSSGQMPMYNTPSHSHHLSATHAPYSHSSRPTEGMHRGQGPTSSIYPDQTPMPNQYLTGPSWQDQDIKPSIPGDFRGLPSTPGYPPQNQQYYSQNQTGAMNAPVQGSWPNSMQQRGYDGYPMPLQGSTTNFSNTGQPYDAMGYGMGSRAYPCTVCQQRHCVCPMRRAT